jgi:hypothetical protein
VEAGIFSANSIYIALLQGQRAGEPRRENCRFSKFALKAEGPGDAGPFAHFECRQG